MPVVGTSTTAGSHRVQSVVQCVSSSAVDWCLTPLDGVLGPPDAVTNALLDAVFQFDATFTQGVVHRLLPKRYVPEVVADAFALKRNECRIDVAKVAGRSAFKRNKGTTTILAASR